MASTDQISSLIATLQSDFGPDWRRSLTEPRPNDPVWRQEIGDAAGVDASNWRFGLDKINDILSGIDYRRQPLALPIASAVPNIIRPSNDQISLQKLSFENGHPVLVSISTFSQIRVLGAANLVNAGPILLASSAVKYIMTGANLTAAVPSFGSALAKQNSALSAAGLTNAVPVVSNGTFNKIANFLAGSLTAAIPDLGTINFNQLSNLWTPANLVTAPMAILDGSTVTWSGSNFAATANAGSLGGSIAATLGVTTKGTQLNGKDVVDLSGGRALGIVGRNWPAANVSIFVVFNPNHNGVVQGIASMGFYGATTGWAFYPTDSGGNLEGHTINISDQTIFGSGGDSTQNRMVAAPPAAGWAIEFLKIGTENIVRNNGNSITPSYSVTGPVGALTNMTLHLGSGNSISTVNETFDGQIAYLAVLSNPVADDILRLEGWAAWQFGLQANLPIGHVYKSAPPTVMVPVQLANKIPTIGAPALQQLSSGGNMTNIAPTLGAPVMGITSAWTPANLITAPSYIFDPTTFTYSGSNFSSGVNGGSVGGAWTAESGTVAKGTQLNGRDVLAFTGTQSILNSTAAWPGGNVYVFAVVAVPTTAAKSLVSASWFVGEGADWVFYPRGGSGFGGSVNEAWLFNSSAAVLTRGDIYTDSSYHIACVKIGTSAELRKDGTVGSPTIVTGTIVASATNNVRVGASGPSGNEAITASVAYVAVLQNPTTNDIQKLEGWAAWRFGLQGNLPAGHPYKSAAPTTSSVASLTAAALTNITPTLGAPVAAIPGTWTPANLATAALYIFDPNSFTYSGSNFSSGNNGGSVGGSWTAESGTGVKGTQLNGKDVLSLNGTQGFLNSTSNWPGGNVYVFAVANVPATASKSLASSSWATGEGANWAYYPRGGNGFGGSVNEAWIFNNAATRITRGDIFTDSSYHIGCIKLGTTAELRKDGTVGSPTTTTGAIVGGATANVRIGASGPSANEAISATIAYVAILQDPTTTDIQKLEGWAAWRFNLVSQLDAGHPYKSAAP